jgi:hypothetical protein
MQHLTFVEPRQRSLTPPADGRSATFRPGWSAARRRLGSASEWLVRVVGGVVHATARPAISSTAGPSTAGTSRACPGCGRPARVRQDAADRDDTEGSRSPVRCGVCSLTWVDRVQYGTGMPW